MNNTSTVKQQPVIIIGGGPAGLTTAYELSKLGMPSIVLEGDKQVGGLSRTVTYQGYRFDIGGHRFFSKVPYVNQLWQEILGEDFLLRPRLSRIHYRGHFFDYPLKMMNALAGLGPLETFLICLSYGKAKFFPKGQETNFEEWVSNRFGYRLYNIFFKTYTEKVWGIPCWQISSDWAAQRIKNLSLKEAVQNALTRNGKLKNDEIITTLIEQFHYPRFGPGMMWERCEELIADQGNPTIRDQWVERICHRKGQVECLIARNTAGERTEFSGDYFVSSMSVRELLFALDPLPPDEIVCAAYNLHYRDYLTVGLIMNRDNVFPDNWIYIHTPEVQIGRIQNYKNWSTDMVPDLTKTSLGLEYFLSERSEKWNWPDEQLIELGIRECAQIGLIEPAEVEDGTIVRMEKAYPVYDHNYRKSLGLIRQYLGTFKNLQTIGRNGLHRYNNQDHSMLTGVYAARNILGEQYDVWSVNTEKEYHEEDRRIGASTTGERLVPVCVKPFEEQQQLSPDKIIDDAFARLDPLAMGIAVGLVMGIGIFFATAILLIKGGPIVGPTLSLLSQYLWGFNVSWDGAFIGFIEVGIGGFTVGQLISRLRNWGMSAYADWLRRQEEVEENKDLLEKL